MSARYKCLVLFQNETATSTLLHEKKQERTLKNQWERKEWYSNAHFILIRRKIRRRLEDKFNNKDDETRSGQFTL